MRGTKEGSLYHPAPQKDTLSAFLFRLLFRLKTGKERHDGRPSPYFPCKHQVYA
jgi:hypothetical protein